MKLINLEKAIGYAKEKDYIKTAGQEKAVREVFALATVEAVPIDVIDKIIAHIEEIETYDGIYIDRAYVLEILDKCKEEGSNKE